MYAIGVARTSTNKQDLNNQVDIINNYIKGKEWVVKDIIKIKHSAYNHEWENKILEIVDAIDENIRHIVYTSVDRASRSMVAFCSFIDKLKNKDVTLHFIIENYHIHISDFFPTTPIAVQIYNMINNSQNTSAISGEKIKLSKENLRNNYGAFVGGSIPEGMMTVNITVGDIKYKTLRDIDGYSDLKKTVLYLRGVDKIPYENIVRQLNFRGIYYPKFINGKLEYFWWDITKVKSCLNTKCIFDTDSKLSELFLSRKLKEKSTYKSIIDEKCIRKIKYYLVEWCKNDSCWISEHDLKNFTEIDDRSTYRRVLDFFYNMF